jgi:membrane-bound serine protease (ClpP class)
MMLANDLFNFDYVASDEILTASTVVFTGMFGSILLLFVIGYRFTNSNMFKRVALVDTQKSEDGYTSSFYVEPLIGKEGTAFTILRPSGRIEIDGTIYDAYTRGEYIEKGDTVQVISQEGTSLKVRSKTV